MSTSVSPHSHPQSIADTSLLSKDSLASWQSKSCCFVRVRPHSLILQMHFDPLLCAMHCHRAVSNRKTKPAFDELTTDSLIGQLRGPQTAVWRIRERWVPERGTDPARHVGRGGGRSRPRRKSKEGTPRLPQASTLARDGASCRSSLVPPCSYLNLPCLLKPSWPHLSPPSSAGELASLFSQ